jgi:SAM-dependent methyltransferase
MEDGELGNDGERAIPNQLNLYEFKRIYSLVSSVYGNNDRVTLDYGCGSGYGTLLLSKHFGKVTGIDVSPIAIDYCKNNYSASNLDFKLLDPTIQPFANKSFHHIFSFQVFEHVPLELTNKYFQNIWNMLKQDGVAIVTTPNAYNYHHQFSGNQFHVKEYTKLELESLLIKVIPHHNFNIYAVEDVPSTKYYLKLRKMLRQGYESPSIIINLFCRILRLTLKVMELFRCIQTDHKNMIIRDNPENIYGSYYIEILKKGK